MARSCSCVSTSEKISRNLNLIYVSVGQRLQYVDDSENWRALANLCQIVVISNASVMETQKFELFWYAMDLLYKEAADHVNATQDQLWVDLILNRFFLQSYRRILSTVATCCSSCVGMISSTSNISPPFRPSPVWNLQSVEAAILRFWAFFPHCFRIFYQNFQKNWQSWCKTSALQSLCGGKRTERIPRRFSVPFGGVTWHKVLYPL